MRSMRFWYRPAFVAIVLSPSRVRIWLKHPQDEEIQYDLKKTIEIDLSKTPSNRAIRWHEIEVDDHVNHPLASGYTSLGPLIPQSYGTGAVYLSDAYLRKNNEAAKSAGFPFLFTDDIVAKTALVLSGEWYEETSLVLDDRGELRRYHGVHVHSDLGGSPHKLLAIHHANTSHDARPPLILRVPSHEILQSGSPYVSTLPEGGAYLSQTLATEAGLDVPKRPSGSGEGLRSEAVRTSGTPLSGGPLNVFGAWVSDEVDRIQDKLNGNWVPFLGDQLSKIFDAVNDQARFSSLDLIGHARSADGVLKLGGFPFTPDTVKEQLTIDFIDKMKKHGISQLRLVGCRTACSAAARKAIESMAECFQGQQPLIEVIGTRGDVFAVHFDAGFGFAEEKLLVPQAISLGGGPGDPPPADDRPVRSPSQRYENTTQSPALRSVNDLPRAGLARVTPKEYRRWALEEVPFDELLKIISSAGVPEHTITPPDLELIVVDGEQLRSMTVFNSDPNRRRVAIVFDNVSFSYSIRLPGPGQPLPSQKLMTLLGLTATAKSS